MLPRFCEYETKKREENIDTVDEEDEEMRLIMNEKGEYQMIGENNNDEGNEEIAIVRAKGQEIF